jgi:putative lipoic acid-binding regulatory protein
VKRPEIEYPCSWTYRIVCTEDSPVRAAIAGLVGDARHSLAEVRTSQHGRYRTLELELEVRDEEHRNSIFKALRELREVRFVL